MSEIKLRKNPDSGEVFMWEPGQDDWRPVQARKNVQSGEVFVFGDQDEDWRSIGKYEGVQVRPHTRSKPVQQQVAAQTYAAPGQPQAPGAVQTAPRIDQRSLAQDLPPDLLAAMSMQAPSAGQAPNVATDDAARMAAEALAVPPRAASTDAMQSDPLLSLLLAPRQTPARGLGAEAPRSPEPTSVGGSGPVAPVYDPFAGESFGDLATRRGQEVAQGAVGVLSSVARAQGIDDKTLADAIQRDAPDRVKEAARQAARFDDILARGVSDDGQSQMTAQERQLYTQRRDEAALAVEQWSDVQEFGPAFVGDRQGGAERAGKAMIDWTNDTFGQPPKDDSLWSELAYGTGSMIGFAAPAVVAGPAGLAVTAKMGSSAAKVEAYDRAKQAGASERDAQIAAQIMGFMGTAEALPIAHALNRIPESVRNDIIGRIGRFVSASAKGSIEEAVQEAGLAIGQNLTERGVYNAERQIIDKDVGHQAIIGGILGGIMGGGANMAGLQSPRGKDDVPDPILQAMGATQNVQEKPIPRAAPVAPAGTAAGQAPQQPTLEADPETRKPQNADILSSMGVEPEPARTEEEESENIRIMDETENVNGETVPTGRKVRVNLDTGEVSPVEDEPARSPEAESVPVQSADNSVLGSEPAAGPVEPDTIDKKTESRIITRTLSTDEVRGVDTDAKTFQYKDGGDTAGVTDRLQGVTDWDERSAMGGIVYEYADGRRVVADGHQRLGLAKRLQENGVDTPWTVEVIREADGFTPSDVRRIAALKNIREGSGTPIDAAKVLREAPSEADALNLAPNSALVRDARGLAKLSDDAFGAVVNGVVPEAYGAVVGQQVPDKALHADVIGLLAKLKPQNARQAAMIAQQAGQASVTETQTSLFGDEDVAESLYLERAKVLDNALNRIKQDRQTFKVLANRADTITAEGNVLDSEANTKRLETDAEMQAYLQAEANRKGPISDALTAAARDLKANPRQIARIAGDFLEKLRQEPGRVRPDRAAPDQQEREDEGQQAAVTPQAAPEAQNIPATETTPEGEQSLIPGTREDQGRDTSRDRAEIEARAKQSKKGTTAAQAGAGPLFGDEGGTQGDMFAPSSAGDSGKKPGQFVNRNTNEPSSDYKDLSSTLKPIPVEKIGSEAQRLTLEPGRVEGIEFSMMIDADGQILSYGSGHQTGTGKTPAMDLVYDREERIVLHHNHPSSNAFSPADYAFMVQGGVQGIYAHAHDGSVFYAKATNLARRRWASKSNRKAFDEITAIFDRLWKDGKSHIQAHVESGFYGVEQDAPDGVYLQPGRDRSIAFLIAMQEAGFIEFTVTGPAEQRLSKENNPYLFDPAMHDAYIKAIKALKRLQRITAPETEHDRPADGRRHPGELEIAPRQAAKGDTAGRSDKSRDKTGSGSDRGKGKSDDLISLTAPPARAKTSAAPRADKTSSLSTAEQDKLAQLRARFRDKMKNQLNAGLDPELVAISVEMASIYVKAGARRFRDLLRAMMEDLGLTFDQAQPYARAAYNQTRDDLDLDGEDISDMDSAKAVIDDIRAIRNGETDAPGTSSDLEPDSGDTAAGDDVGGTDVPASRGSDGAGAGGRRDATDAGGGQRQSGGRVSDGGAAGVGTESDTGVQRGKRAERQPSNDQDGPGSRDRGQQRLPIDEGTAADTERHAADAANVSDRRAQQAKADRHRVIPGDEASVRQSLPLLLPEQQDDVVKVEQRFAKPDGHGMLLTNGTGTGKTYSGGGVIKRFAQQGKTNVLILAPSQGILDAWVEMGADMGLDITKLGDAKSAGTGIVATTYANADLNNELATREWDLVVSDEAHKLSSNATGDATGALNTLRAVTHRPENIWYKVRMLHAEELDALYPKEPGPPRRASPEVEEKRRQLNATMQAETKALAAKAKRSKVLFLSATPFAYDKNVDYAEGYLFNYGQGGTTPTGSNQDGRAFFFVENFGYRIRYHKLTKPEAAVDNGVFEREFHEKMKRDGVLSGRALDVDADYDRKFITVDDSEASRIDEVMQYIWDKSDNTSEGREWRELADHVNRNFTYLRRMQLLEAVKAKAAIPIIRSHLALGRKVVVFHDYNVGGGFNPFTGSDVVTPTADAMKAYARLKAQMPFVTKMNFAGYKAPIEAFTDAFGDDALFYNGTVSNKKRDAAKAEFNKDGSGKDLIVVQSAAGEAGISLHDTTGNHQRVLINLGMPTRPTTTLQEEGRIRRVGSVTDAAFRYLTIGTNWERDAFARKIAERSGTVENLALGNEARAIRDAFIDSYMAADEYPAGESDGRGGKEADRSVAKTSPFDQAKAHYFGRMKDTRKRSQRAGVEHYATPEPLGFKMAEWAGVRTYEKVLEPSAGDGAIARYFPGDSDRTIIEPTSGLLTKAQLRAPGATAHQARFEDHHIVNKYDAVVMNPPFGSGGSTAFAHLEKAMGHTKERGRIVALVPTGPAADKRWEKVNTGDWSVSVIKLPAVTFEKAGTSVPARILIMDKIGPRAKNADLHTEMDANSQYIDLSGAKSITDLFNDLEHLRVPPRPEPLVEPETEETTAPPTIEAGGDAAFDTFEFENTKTGADVYGVQIKENLGDRFREVSGLAKQHGGYYSKYQNKAAGAKRGFLFKTEAERTSCMDNLQKPTVSREQLQRDQRPEVIAEAITPRMAALRAELDRLNLKRVYLGQDNSGRDRQGGFEMNLIGQMRILIGASLDEMATLHHEAIHAMRAMNLFSPAEWRALEIKAARSWVEKHDIQRRYPDLPPSEQIEEAIAEEFAAWAKGDAAPTGILGAAFAKIKRLLEALRNVFAGAGFQTADDVFSRAISGDIGARDRNVDGFGVRLGLRDQAMPVRQTAQARAHASTNMMGSAAHIPNRGIWDELARQNSGVWKRLRGAAGAAHDQVDRARIKIQDRFLPVLRAQEAIVRENGQALPEDQNAYLAEETFSGKVGRHLFEIDEDYTKPILDLMVGEKGESLIDEDYVGEWLYARHAIERNAKIASINPKMPDGGSGMTNADAAAILSQAAAGPHAARLKAIGAKIDHLRERTLKLRQDAGLITDDEARAWRSQYKHYVPLKGFAETEHSEAMLDVTGVGRRFNTRGAESQRALGRRSEAFNPLQSAMTQAQEVAIRAEKNRVGQALYSLARENPAPNLWEIKTPKQKQYYNRSTGLVETRVEDPISLILQPNEMAVKVDGKEQRILFNDMRLAQAAGTVGADQMNWFIGLMSKASRFFSSVNTMLDPEFVIRNAFRDMQAAQFNIRNFGKEDRNKLAKAMLKSWPKAFVGAYRGQGNHADSEWTRYYKEFEQSGAKVSFWKLDQPEAAKGDLRKRLNLAGGNILQRGSRFFRLSTRDNPVLGFIERTNLAVDNAVRLAAYVEARKLGWTKAEAASLSKNLTVNFNRRGEWGATINALYPFANAGIQGTQVMFRALTSKRMAKYAFGLVTLGAILDQVNASLSDEDDDGELAYDKIPDWKNQMNLVVMLGPEAGNAATLWMPYGYSLFPYLGQQASKVARGVKDPGDALADFAAGAFGAFSPLGGRDLQSVITPTMLDPINEMAMNEDWLGRPIRPENPWADYGPDAYKYYGGVSDVSKAIADAANRVTGGTIAESGWLDVSPEYIDHAFGFAVGGAGRFVGRAADTAEKLVTGRPNEIESRNIPFYRSLQYETGSWLDRDRYYAFRDEVKAARDAQKTYRENRIPVPDDVQKLASLYGLIKDADKFLRETRTRKKAVLAREDLDFARRQAVISRIEEQNENVYLRFNRAFLRRMGPQGE